GSDDKLIFGIRAGNQGGTKIAHATSEYAYGELIAALRDDPDRALIATYPLSSPSAGSRVAAATTGVFPEVYKIDLRTGVKARVTTSPLHNARFLADRHGAVRFAFGQDYDQKEKVYYRAEGGEWELVVNEQSRTLAPMGFGRDGKVAYFTCDGAN